MSRLDELIDIAVGLEPDALELLVLQASRLRAGAKQYGRLDVERDPRDFVSEILPELIDANAYASMELLKQLRTRSTK